MAENNTDPNPDPTPAGGEELVSIIDPKTKQEFKIPKGAHLAMNHTIELARKSLRSESDTKMNSLLQQLQDKEITAQQYADKILELEDANKTAEQRAADKLKRELNALSTERDQYKTQLSEKDNRLRSLIIEQTVGQAIAGHEVNDLTATMRLLLSDYQHEVKEENGSYSVVLRSTDGEELTPKEAVSQYLAREDRSFLLRSSLKSGSGAGAPGTRRSTDGALIYDPVRYKNDEDYRNDFRKRRKAGENVTLG